MNVREPASFDVDADMARAAAESAGVCVRPLIREVLDHLTGASAKVAIACGSTRESACPPCAVKARRLRMHQCREGWHLADDPQPRDTGDSDAIVEDDGGSDPAGCAKERKVRSTRRLDGFPDLPVVEMDDRTIGRTFVDPRTGREHRPSMFLTLTLPSYGRVDASGVPIDPTGYDYRRAAMDAVLFPRLVDRFWQNLRRCAGYKVQYFATVEGQRRLAAHLHAAVRGAIPRQVVKAVAAATYHAAWWPSLDTVIYGQNDAVPVFDHDSRRYIDPVSGRALPTWRESTSDLTEPAHVTCFGRQIDIKGLLAGDPDADRTVRYLCKYLTKSVAGGYVSDEAGNGGGGSAGYRRHIDRLHEEVRWLPCGSRCANWLRFGVEPEMPEPGMGPGRCPAAAHDRENVGLGGRRVLVSRAWTGKTLHQHRADRRAVITAVLESAGVTADEADRLGAQQVMPDGRQRFTWSEVDRRQLDYVGVIRASLRHVARWRAQYDAAKSAVVVSRGSPLAPDHSAIQFVA